MTSLVQWFNESSEYEIDGKKLAIKIVGTSEKPWFKARDVCNALGYTSAKDALHRHVKPQYKTDYNTIFSESSPDGPKIDARYEGQQPYITKRGCEILMSKCKKLRDKNFIKTFATDWDLNVNIVQDTKEQEFIGAIRKAFSHLSMEPQFRIGDYRIDLYLTSLKIAVECDERGHSDRDVSKEVARQAYIENQLGCRFLRFNPDAKDFCIYDTINELMRMVYDA
jgi:very-short-patch-repair endonuclease